MMLHLKPQPKKEINPMNAIFKLFGGLGVVGVVIAIILLVVLWPLVVVWALNTLFGLGIAYTFWNWLAALVLITVFTSRSNTEKK